jgi:putative transposase
LTIGMGWRHGVATLRKTKFSQPAIFDAVNEAKNGLPVQDIASRLGVSKATVYNWLTKFGSAPEQLSAKVNELSSENNRLKKSQAQLDSEAEILRKLVNRMAVQPSMRFESVIEIMAEHGLSERRACAIVGVDRSSFQNYRKTTG